MTSVVSFEIYIYKNSIWNIDSAYDDQQIALFEARMLADDAAILGVRVVREGGHDDKAGATSKVIFQKVKKTKPPKSAPDKKVPISSASKKLKEDRSKSVGKVIRNAVIVVSALILAGGLMVVVRAMVRGL